MPIPSVYIERSAVQRAATPTYTLSVNDGRHRMVAWVGETAVQHMQCESHAPIEESWVNQSQNVKSWVTRFASGATVAALVDEHDQLIELEAQGFVLTPSHPQDAVCAKPLHLQDCL